MIVLKYVVVDLITFIVFVCENQIGKNWSLWLINFVVQYAYWKTECSLPMKLGFW